LRRKRDKIILLISDNGKGCDVSKKRKGVGINNIIGRAEQCNGKADIESKPGEGFQVRVIFPSVHAKNKIENGRKTERVNNINNTN
jgi:signal transduction histidine kinase